MELPTKEQFIAAMRFQKHWSRPPNQDCAYTSITIDIRPWREIPIVNKYIVENPSPPRWSAPEEEGEDWFLFDASERLQLIAVKALPKPEQLLVNVDEDIIDGLKETLWTWWNDHVVDYVPKTVKELAQQAIEFQAIRDSKPWE